MYGFVLRLVLERSSTCMGLYWGECRRVLVYVCVCTGVSVREV